ncbi:unnamed protein product [Lampetra planeri]
MLQLSTVEMGAWDNASSRCGSSRGRFTFQLAHRVAVEATALILPLARRWRVRSRPPLCCRGKMPSDTRTPSELPMIIATVKRPMNAISNLSPSSSGTPLPGNDKSEASRKQARL